MNIPDELKEMEKFDTHSHIGIDVKHPFPSNLPDYVRLAKAKGIRRAILIGVPLPRYAKGGGVYSPFNWEVNGMGLDVYSQFEDQDGRTTRAEVTKNPFAESNMRLERQVVAESSPNLRLHFAPHVHPLYDTQSHLEATLGKKPIAVKVHGSSWGIDPNGIPPSFFNLLRRHDVPLIVHTDYNTAPRDGRQLIQRLNDPLVWIELCERYGVRASLAHGLRLCADSWKRVSRAGDQFIVGMGPKLDPCKSHRVKVGGVDYTTALLEMADLTRLTYDVDFAWNTKDYVTLDWTLDNELVGRVSDEQLRRIYHGNAEDFYKIKKGGID